MTNACKILFEKPEERDNMEDLDVKYVNSIDQSMVWGQWRKGKRP
jgi:hypothetical protein